MYSLVTADIAFGYNSHVLKYNDDKNTPKLWNKLR